MVFLRVSAEKEGWKSIITEDQERAGAGSGKIRVMIYHVLPRFRRGC